jgi:hypothetical protein
MITYIKESNKRIQDRSEYMLYNVPVYVINKFSKHIKINNILNSVKEKINKNFLNGLDAIYIGDFDDLNKRKIQSMLKDGAIWISSNNIINVITETLVAENIIHEVAHLLEDRFQEILYSSGGIEQEYESKKQRLYSLLKADGYEITPELFFSDDHLREFDSFLYQEVGYDKLSLLSAGLFFSPYSITSIREYFANGFLLYLSEEHEYLKDLSPVLYSKIIKILNKLNNEEINGN